MLDVIKILCFVLCLSFLSSCAENEDMDIIEEKPINSNIALNQWVYDVFDTYYLWREDLPLKDTVNFAQNIGDFFKTIKSPKDRFSYYEVNPNYNGGTRGAGDGLQISKPILQTTRSYSNSDVKNDTIFTIHTKILPSLKVGYIRYDSFGEQNTLEAALKRLRKSKLNAIIIDLRYNHGGSVATAILFSSSLVPEKAWNTPAQYHKYNPYYAEKRFGKADSCEVYNYYDTSTFPATHIDVNNVYFLVSKNTASASESLIRMVQPYLKTTVIGEKTTGKGTGMHVISDNNYAFILSPITFQYYNCRWETVPDDGIVPDIIVEDPLNTSQALFGTTYEPLTQLAIKDFIDSFSACYFDKNAHDFGKNEIEVKEIQ